MADPKGFLTTPRQTPSRRPVDVRIRDWREVYEPIRLPPPLERAGRPLHGLRHPVLPRRLPAGEPDPGVERPGLAGRLARTRSSGCTRPTTSRSSPAGCARRRARRACVLGINADPVTIKQVEVSIIDRAWADGLGRARSRRPRADRPHGRRGRLRPRRAGRRPAADPGRPHGRGVRARRPDRRPAALRHPRVQDGEAAPGPAARPDAGRGHRVPCAASTSAWTSPAAELRADYDAVVLAVGATVPRDLPVPGRDLAGIHQAMEYLPLANRAVRRATGGAADPRSARRPAVVIIGGGDTGADCLGTAHRQGAASVTQLEIMPRPPRRAARARSRGRRTR